MLLELARREKNAGIKPDADLDLFMKAHSHSFIFPSMHNICFFFSSQNNNYKLHSWTQINLLKILFAVISSWWTGIKSCG